MVLSRLSWGGVGIIDNRHCRELGIWWQIETTVEHGAERDVPQIRRRAVIPHDPIGQHGKGVRSRGVEQLSASHADAAATVRMIDEHKLAVVGLRLFQWRKLTGFGAERFVCENHNREKRPPRKTAGEKTTIPAGA